VQAVFHDDRHVEKSLRRIHREQVDAMVIVLRDLIAVYRASGHRIANLVEYKHLISQAYALGFVCPSVDTHAEPASLFEKALSHMTLIGGYSLNEIRYLMHYIVRAERHSDCGGPEGGGVVVEALRSGLLSHVADRLRVLSCEFQD
jgi:hypothetical protein